MRLIIGNQVSNKRRSMPPLALGYKPLRYNGMAHELVPSGKQPREVLTRAAKASAARITHPTIGEP